MERPDDSRGTVDPVEVLLESLLEVEDHDQLARLEALCVQYAELAEELRARFELFVRLRDGTAEAPDPGERFGDYELIRPLGSGGMGVVWLARQRREGVDRTVALKMIRGGRLRSPEARERFRREARALFRVDHAALCAVYDVGEVDGTPYIAMRYVPGRTLAELIADARREGRPLALPAGAHGTSTSGSSRGVTARPLDAILELIETVARALQVAHDAGLVHRDVKPGNIVVTPSGEPVLLDFGLVRNEEDDSSLTLTSQPIGTPAYMAPEQITPRSHAVDRTVDVYGLGATLYECITLEPPFKAETREGLYRAILEDEARPVRRLVRNVPKDLDAIVETALRKDPSRRYTNALDLAEDLRALRAMQPVRARVTGPLTRSVLWVRRNPLASAVLVLLAVALGYALVQGRRAEQRADEARRAQQRAERGFALARNAIDELVLTANERLRDVPRFEPVRHALLDRALTFHEDLALDLESRVSAWSETSHAWEAVADLQLELGRVAAARDAIDTAERKIRERAPDLSAPEVRLVLTGIAAQRGDIARRAGDLPVAEAELRTALDGYRRLRAERPEVPTVALNEARIATTLASLLHQAVRSEAASAVLDSVPVALAAATEVGAPLAEVLDCRAQAATVRGRIARDLQDFDAADRAFEESITTRRELVRAAPNDRSLRSDLTEVLIARSRLRAREGRYEDALADVQESVDLLRTLAQQFPESAFYAGSLATAWNNRYTILMRLDRRDEASASLHEALDLLEQVATIAPDNPASVSDLASVVFNLGNLTRRTEGPAAAIPHYLRTLALLDPVLAASPDDVESVRRAAAAAENAAICHLLLGRSADADPLLDRARHWTEMLVARTPDDPRMLRDLGRIRFNQAARRFDDGEPYAAAQELRACMPLRDRLVEAAPTNVRLQHDALLTRARLSTVLLDIAPGEATEVAESTLSRYDALDAGLRARLESDAAIAANLGTLYLASAEGRARAGDAAAARALRERAWSHLSRATADATDPGWAQADALFAAVRLAAAARDEGRTEDAARAVTDALRVIGPLADQAPLARDVRRALAQRLALLEELLPSLGGGETGARATLAKVEQRLRQ